MPAGITVPTVFTAVDKLSATVAKMVKNIGGFAKTAAFGISRLNDKFNSFFKLGDLSKQFLSLASTAAIAALIISGIRFSATALLDYDKAIAQLHNTLYSVSGGGFTKFQQAVEQTAKSTDSSTIDIANSFKTIAQLDQGLAKSPGSLTAVSKAALTLARATDSELTPATEGLVGVMHIFGLQANQANRIVNVLAAAQANGAGPLEDQIENYKKWGVIAKSANITLEQSAGINAVFGSYLQKGTESATTLRTAIIRLQKAGAGYQSGVFNINDALKQTIGFYDKIKNQRGKDDFLIKLFGPRGASAGRILLDNAQKINDVTKSVTGTNDAFVMAARNMNTVYGLLQRIQNKWVTFITSNNEASKGLNDLKNVLKYVIVNFDSIISNTISAIKWFLILKGAIWAISKATALYGFVTATANAELFIAIGRSALYLAALGANTVATWGLAAAGGALNLIQLALNGTMAAFASGGIIGAVGAVAVAFGAIAVAVGIVISFVSELHKNWKMVTDAFQNGGILSALNAIGKVFVSALLRPLELFFRYIGQLTGFQWAKSLATSGYEDRQRMGINVSDDAQDANPQKKKALLAPTAHAIATHSTSTSQNNLSVDLNDPFGMVKKAKMTGPFPIPVTVTSTTGKQ